VYELTSLGKALEKTLLELGKWGSQFVPPAPEDATVLPVNSYALTLKTFFRPELAQGVNEIYELHVDDEVLQVQIKESQIHVQQGETLKADAIFHTDISSYLRLLQRQIPADEAISRGLIRVEGDPGALSRFLNICGLPSLAKQFSFNL
jgi:ubiquinone biosynthesis protein UbiJ